MASNLSHGNSIQPVYTRHDGGPSNASEQDPLVHPFLSPLLPIMLRYSVILLVITIITAALGFGGVPSTASSVARMLFLLFLVLFVGSLVLGYTAFRKK